MQTSTESVQKALSFVFCLFRTRMNCSAVTEGVVNEDRILPFRARRQESDGRLDQFLDAPDIFDRLSRELGPGPCASGRVLPAGYGFVNGFDAGLRCLARRHAVDPSAVEVIADADFDLLKPIENIELGQRDSVYSRRLHSLPDKDSI